MKIKRNRKAVGTILLAVSVITMTLVMISLISAAEWDNVKTDYNINLKEVTIKNSFLGIPTSEVATAKLLTPQINYVMPGKDRLVAEFSIDLLEDNYKDALKNIKLIDNNNGKALTRDITYKYKTIETYDVEVNDYKENCKLIEGTNNNSQICTREIIGTHKESRTRDIWTALNKLDLTKGEITIGLFTDVKVDDNVEWVPTLFGQSVNEWATWTSSFNVGLVAYYPMNNNTEILYGVMNISPTAVNGAQPTNVSGIIGDAMNWTEPTNSAQINNTSSNAAWNFSGNTTINIWVYRDVIGTGANSRNVLFTKRNPGFYIWDSGTNLLWEGFNSPAITTAKTIPLSNWVMLTFTRNDTNLCIWNNGTLDICGVLPTGGTTGDVMIGNGVSIGEANWQGRFDELGVWNRTLSSIEINNLYNGGLGLTYSVGTGVTLNTPINYFNSSSIVNVFNCSAITEGTTLTNMTLWLNGISNETKQKTGISNESIFTKNLVDGTYTWTCQAKTLNNDNAFAINNRTLTVDTTPPTVNIAHPTGTFSSLINNQNLTLNYTVNEIHPGNCWMDYNGTNTTIPGCVNTSFLYVAGVNTIRVWANDTGGNIGNSTTTWNATITVYSTSFNSTSYETAPEPFTINASGMTAASLVYNGISYAATIVGNIATKILGVTPAANNSFYWNLNTGTYNTPLQYQNVLPLTLSFCNSTNNKTYINFTFADEVTATSLNASLNPATILYSLGSLTSYKTLSFTNITVNPSYAFCFSPPDKTINTSISLVVASPGYPLRYGGGSFILTNTTTNQVITLLSAADGIYQTVIVATGNGVAIQGATVTASTVLDGVVDSRTTDSAGQVALWLNPDTAYTLTISAAGYISVTRVINPSSTAVTITLGAIAGFPANASITYTEGVTYSIGPDTTELYNDTTYQFNFTLNPGIYTIDSFRFDLQNSTGGVIASASSVSNGGTITSNFNIGNDSQITMRASYTINGTTNTIVKVWTITNTEGSGYGLLNFGNRLRTYIGSGLFGLKTGFALNLICFIIVVLTTGIISYKYGFDNPIIIGVIAVSLIAFLELGLGLIETGFYIPLTAWGIIGLVLLLFREGFR